MPQQGGYREAPPASPYPPQAPAPYGSAPKQLSPADEKTWAILAHASPFLTTFIGLNFLGPLIIYLIFKDRGPFVRHHAAQALNFQLIVAIGLIISIATIVLVIGIIGLIAIPIVAIVFMIIAIVETSNGKWYRYPLTPDWVK